MSALCAVFPSTEFLAPLEGVRFNPEVPLLLSGAASIVQCTSDQSTTSPRPKVKKKVLGRDTITKGEEKKKKEFFI